LDITDPQAPATAGRASDLTHAISTPTAKLRLYARTLSECLPTLLGLYRERADSPPLRPDFLSPLPDVPQRLMGLADQMDTVARAYGARGDAPPVAPAGEHGNAPSPTPDPTSRPRVLLVEDDFDTRELTRIMLQLDGWEVSMADDGEPALALLAQQPFDLVLMDCRLKIMDGEEATARLRVGKPNRRVPVIGLSVSPLETDRARALAAGMDDYIVKPLTDAHLADLRRRYLRQATS
jgi:CheY-like chemotaxis protein